MGIPTNFKTLLSGNVVEWARIEFKETWDAEASLKTICAFANDIDNWGGGYLVIGVEEKNGKPTYLKERVYWIRKMARYFGLLKKMDHQNRFLKQTKIEHLLLQRFLFIRSF